MDELRECPFCGGEAEFYSDSDIEEMGFAEKISKACSLLAEAWEEMFSAIAEIAEAIIKLIEKIMQMEPRKRYKIVKKLGSEIYPMFFRRPGQYRCRNNC